jgi:hypothetical protein
VIEKATIMDNNHVTIDTVNLRALVKFIGAFKF